MTGEWKRNRKLYIWLLADLAALAFFLLGRHSRWLMNGFTTYVTEPLKRGIASVCYLTEISVAEIIYVALPAVVILCLGASIRKLVESRRRWQLLWKGILGTACTVLTIYVGMCLLWGVNYYTDTFQDRSGLYGRGATVEELEQLTAYFAENLSACSGDVRRDERGVFAENRADIFAAAPGIYQGIYEEFPFLEKEDRVPKAFSNSRVLSAMDFTGFYFPFTGETNLNVDCPAAFLPATIVHELGHQRGIASEQACNFLAVVVSIASDDPVYRYSGWLMGYTHLGNALYRADPERWQAIRDTLPETVVQDIRYNNAYWQSFESPVNDAAQNAYDAFLKNYGDENGVESYGMVVDLLIDYYL